MQHVNLRHAVLRLRFVRQRRLLRFSRRFRQGRFARLHGRFPVARALHRKTDAQHNQNRRCENHPLFHIIFLLKLRFHPNFVVRYHLDG